MKIKTQDLIGLALDWAVAKCEDRITADGHFLFHTPQDGDFRSVIPERYSTDWAQGGPIIERERLTVQATQPGNVWTAYTQFIIVVGCGSGRDGPTPLIAAMRCYVVSKLGDEVDVPEELV